MDPNITWQDLLSAMKTMQRLVHKNKGVVPDVEGSLKPSDSSEYWDAVNDFEMAANSLSIWIGNGGVPPE